MWGLHAGWLVQVAANPFPWLRSWRFPSLLAGQVAWPNCAHGGPLTCHKAAMQQYLAALAGRYFMGRSITRHGAG